MASQRSRSSRRNPPPAGEAPDSAPPPARPPEPAPEARPSARSGPERIGDTLKRIREKRGDDLDQIAEYLCIRPTFLRALEGNRYDELPADAYVIGFLRSYANYLGFDGREAIDRYRREMQGQRKKPVLTMPIPVSEGRAPSVAIMLGAAIAALLVYALWYGLSTSDRAVVTAPPPLPAVPAPADTATNGTAAPTTLVIPPAPPALAAAPDAAHPAAPVSLAYGSAAENHFVIRAEKESWVLLTDSKGKTVFDHVLKAGDTYKVPDEEGLRLTTGNASGIVLVVDGTDMPNFAGNQRVLRDFPLDIGKLKGVPVSVPPPPAE